MRREHVSRAASRPARRWRRRRGSRCRPAGQALGARWPRDAPGAPLPPVAGVLTGAEAAPLVPAAGLVLLAAAVALLAVAASAGWSSGCSWPSPAGCSAGRACAR